MVIRYCGVVPAFGSLSARPPPLRRLKLWLQDKLLRLSLAGLSYVLLVNAVVRHVGHGDAQALSLRRLEEKSYAIARLLGHMLVHPLRTEEDHIQNVVTAAARRHGVNPDLALNVARAESGFYPHAVSSTGAMGIMQLMPHTAQAYGVRDPFDVRDNAEGGTRLLKDLLTHYRGDRRRVLAAYNAGTARVPRRGPYRIPPSTRAYVSRVLSDWSRARSQ